MQVAKPPLRPYWETDPPDTPEEREAKLKKLHDAIHSSRRKQHEEPKPVPDWRPKNSEGNPAGPRSQNGDSGKGREAERTEKLGSPNLHELQGGAGTASGTRRNQLIDREQGGGWQDQAQRVSHAQQQ